MTALTKMFAFGARNSSAIIGCNYYKKHMTDTTIKVESQIPLKGFSTFKVGGKAKYFLTINDKEQLKEAVMFAKENSLEILCIGGGSNLLISDEGFQGLVLKLDILGINIIPDNTNPLLKVSAGEPWDNFVDYTLNNNFFGLENLSLIPGSVGASVVQNIGAYGVEVKDFVEYVEVFNTDKFLFETLTRDECEFGYRMSVFKKDIGNKFIVVSVAFRLNALPKINISYKDLNNYFKEDNKVPTPTDVRNAVINIRKNKFPDLSVYGTAGSFFKNIICKADDIYDLLVDHPELPVYKHNEDHVKVSTAYILDKVCGLKGFRKGNVGLFNNQSLVVVNFGEATSNEIINFISEIKKIVFEKTKLILEEEVVII